MNPETSPNSARARLAALESSIDKAFARMGMIEFAFEIIWANKLASDPIESSQKFKADFLQLMHNPELPSSFTPESQQKEAEIVRLGTQMAERFIQKVAVRETLIRESRGNDSLPPESGQSV